MRHIWFVLLVITIIGGGWFLFRADKTVEAVTVTQGYIAQTIVATGKVVPPATIEIGSLITASIAQVLVDEGDNVVSGQPIIELSDQTVMASYVQAERSLQEAEQRLQELNTLVRPLAEHTLAQAQTNVSVAKAEHHRNIELSAKKMIAPQVLEQSKRTLDNAQASLESAQLQLSASQESGITHRLLINKIAQAKAGLAVVQAKRDQLTLRAPSNGVIIGRSAEVGAVAQIGKPLLTLAMTGARKIELPIDEKNIRYLSLNQPAVVVADAYPKHDFSAHLSFISPLVDAARATINTELIIDQPPEFLRHNMTVSVEIPIRHADNALIVPTDVIQERDTDAPWVWRIDAHNRIVKTAVTLGIQGIGDTQVMSGLSMNDWVISDVNHLKTLKEGMSVSPTPRVKHEKPAGFDLPKGLN